MNRIKKRITLTLVKQLVASGEPCLVLDTDVPGFQVRVAKAVTYRVRWTKGRGEAGRKEKLYSIGHYPAMLPDEARAEALTVCRGFDRGFKT